MTATSTAVPVRTGTVQRARPLSGRRTVTLAAVYYLLAALALTLWQWRDPASRTVAGNPYDADQFAWFFRYDATAIAHWHLPALVTTAMNAPQGVNVMWNTFMLLPGVVLAPVTLACGPQVSLTLLLTMGFAGSATAMFAVLRRWQVSVPAAALGAAVYGFSPALVHSAIGHYDLQFAVFPPLIVDAVLRLATGRSSARRGGLLLGLLVTVQLFISEEILFDAGLAAFLLLIVLAASRPPDASRDRRDANAARAGTAASAQQARSAAAAPSATMANRSGSAALSTGRLCSQYHGSLIQACSCPKASRVPPSENTSSTTQATAQARTGSRRQNRMVPAASTAISGQPR